MEEEFKTHISAEHSLFDLHLKETFQYRDLIILYYKMTEKSRWYAFSVLKKRSPMRPLIIIKFNQYYHHIFMSVNI